MCVHHWIIDSQDKGICRHCGQKKDFAPPPVKLTSAERAEMRFIPSSSEYYMQGVVRLDNYYEKW